MLFKCIYLQLRFTIQALYVSIFPLNIRILSIDCVFWGISYVSRILLRKKHGKHDLFLKKKKKKKKEKRESNNLERQYVTSAIKHQLKKFQDSSSSIN